MDEITCAFRFEGDGAQEKMERLTSYAQRLGGCSVGQMLPAALEPVVFTKLKSPVLSRAKPIFTPTGDYPSTLLASRGPYRDQWVAKVTTKKPPPVGIIDQSAVAKVLTDWLGTEGEGDPPDHDKARKLKDKSAAHWAGSPAPELHWNGLLVPSILAGITQAI